MSRILVVDDDPAGLRLVKYMLSPEGYEVLTASNGIEGLRTALQEVPDLIVLDVMLPGLDGFEVCHRLRSGAKTARIPVIMLSGKAQAIDRDTGLKVGADEYLVKPVDRRELLDIVQRLLAQREVGSQKRAKIIAFVGSRGGVGTSTVVTSTSVVLAEEGYPPILVDLCPSFGVVPDLMELKPKYTIAKLFRGATGTFNREDLKAALTQHSTGVRLLSGEQDPEEYGRVTPDGIELLLRELGAMADYVLIDIPASSSELTGAALTMCNFVNLVTGPEHQSLSRISSTVDMLSKLGIEQKQIGVVVVDRNGIGISTEVLTSTSINGCPIMGLIPCDVRECTDAEERGIPIVLASPSSPVAVALRRLAKKLLSLEQLAPYSKTNNEGS